MAGRRRADRCPTSHTRRGVKAREPLRIPIRAADLPVLAAACGMAATLAYFYATHFSMLAIAAVLVALYPGVTVLLARVLLHERFSLA